MSISGVRTVDSLDGAARGRAAATQLLHLRNSALLRSSLMSLMQFRFAASPCQVLLLCRSCITHLTLVQGFHGFYI